VLPEANFKPTGHLHYAETVLPVRDELPKLKDFRDDPTWRFDALGASHSPNITAPDALTATLLTLT
jgi:hypothetical protein